MRFTAPALAAVLAVGVLPATAAEAAPRRPAKKPVPIAKLWPKAVHKIPAKLKNGRQIRPEALIGHREVLFDTWSSFEKANALYAYDLRTGKIRKLGKVITPKGAVLFASDYTVGGGKIAWKTATKTETQIWTLPVKGGKATKAVASKTDVNRFTLSGGKLHWSTADGVYTLPKAGAQPVKVKDSAGWQIVHWPWIGTPGPTQEPAKDQFIYGKLRNVTTGRTRAASFTPKGTWACGAVWCVNGEKAVRLDGSAEIALPGHGEPPYFLGTTPLLGRFVTSNTYAKGSQVQYVTDLRTGRVGSLSWKGNGFRVFWQADNALWFQTVKGKHVILDLAAIR